MSFLRATKPSSPCPCSSGVPFRDCCAPFHSGAREPESPVLLMRSRYSAFATGAIDHLMRTLHPDHPDRAIPTELLRANLQKTCRAFRYTGLVIEAHSETGDSGTVTFFAKLFERGTDHSFRERSTFGRTREGWRYLSGEPLPREGSPLA